MLHGDHDRVKALHVKEGLLLTGEGGVRHIFRCGGGAYGEGRFGIVGGELLVGLANSRFQLRLERGIHDPLTDLLTGFRQLIDIVNVGLVQ